MLTQCVAKDGMGLCQLLVEIIVPGRCYTAAFVLPDLDSTNRRRTVNACNTHVHYASLTGAAMERAHEFAVTVVTDQ